MKSQWVVLLLIAFSILGCYKDEAVLKQGPTTYQLNIPTGLPAMVIPADNPLTVEGVYLGRMLFYDPILSGDNTQSCGSCHLQQHGFTDGLKYSVGIDGIEGKRNSMPLINLGWQSTFFWDGGATDLESQALDPVVNPIEMHDTWENAIAEIRTIPMYQHLFKKAFGIDEITVPYVVKAIAQFERTLISGDSKYDQYKRGEAFLTPLELQGMDLFTDMSKGDCNHCHVLGSTFSDFAFRNTGLDSIPEDEGRFSITWNPSDKGKFKTPSLRNIALTAPYMHDGRFNTLLECVEHYNTGFHYTANLDPNLYSAQKGRMTQQEMEAIVAFMHTLTDESFMQNADFFPVR